jgi:hypothetical protein
VYNVSALPSGRYSITVQANGFKTIHQSDVILEVAQHARALPNPTNSAGRSPTRDEVADPVVGAFQR